MRLFTLEPEFALAMAFVVRSFVANFLNIYEELVSVDGKPIS